MFQELLKTWFEWSRDMGYAGVFAMMALESTIIPVPSEIIMPPAGYWAEQGQLSMFGVILSGSLGSTFGSSLCYWFSRTLGRSFLERYGKLLLLPPERLELAERWLNKFAFGGVFLARLLPVVRHLIGFPAGLVRMPFVAFAAITSPARHSGAPCSPSSAHGPSDASPAS
ncbi:MAG: DedA family protein [Acidobacteriota bacterium]